MSKPSSREHFFNELETFFSHAETCRSSFRMLIHFAIQLAGTDDARRVLTIVEHSPEANLFAPLVGGLRIYLGETSDAVGISDDIARQIANRIKEAAGARQAVA
ncbi:MAG: hypothetical protein WC205_03475 [Opitutaceae bacterium]|jgi:hypothetical protein